MANPKYFPEPHQWDAADQFQVVQNYFSYEIRQGHVPFWTPYPGAGYPFLADRKWARGIR